MNVQVSVRDVRLPDDAAALRSIDTSYVTDAHYVVRRDGARMGLGPMHLDQSQPRGFDTVASDLDRDDRPWHSGLVAVTGADSIVGFAAAGFEQWNRRLRIWHFYVAKAYRRRGIARRLYAEVKLIGDRLDASHIFVETPNVNAPAIRAYQQLGMEIVGFDTSLYAATQAEGEVAVYLAQPLG